MRLVLITENFLPLRNSGAVQLWDLAREFVRQGHELTVFLPSADLQSPWFIEEMDGIQLLRLKTPPTKVIGYVRRTLNEFWMPFAMRRQLRCSPFAQERFDGVVWYSPSIFHGPLVQTIKRRSNCPSYLIIRDIFPQWAVDMGLIGGRGLPYQFFDAVARYQYSVADVIGVQTPGNLAYFDSWLKNPGRRLEVLQNWLDKPAQIQCSIRIDETSIAGRKVFVYAGNMGVAQGMGILLDLAKHLQKRKDVGFLFVGRGSDAAILKTAAQQKALDNIVFFDEIHPDEIPNLYDQCSAGIVALDPRHRSHNIPGKFITYMQSGLPVLANVNKGNDLVNIIKNERVGQVCENNDSLELKRLAEHLLEQIEIDVDLPLRCKTFFEKQFAVKSAVEQIIAALSVK